MSEHEGVGSPEEESETERVPFFEVPVRRAQETSLILGGFLHFCQMSFLIA